MESQQQLELEKFFERDIIEFLDEKSREILGNEKGASFDFIYEQIEKSLQKRDVESAINLLEEVANKYNGISLDDAYKPIIYNEFMELIELAKSYVEKGLKDVNLDEIISQVMEMDETKESSLPDKISAFQKIKMERARKKIEEEEKIYKSQEELNKKRKLIEKNLFINIRKKRVKEAMLDYKQLKDLFEEYPSKFEEEKQEFYNDILAFFMQIKKLKQELEEKMKEQQIKTNSMQPPPEPEVDPAQVQEIMNKIKEFVYNHDFNYAKNKLIDLKQMASKIQNRQIREILESKITSINQNIELAKKAAEQKT